ncbi:MAG TPA: diguanylate cyclase, partial [Pseudoneobacillus sp.]|nr:diguanylate cyclase [Pseudoneobacillus sp.]
SQHSVKISNNQINVSFSTGVALYPEHGSSVDSLKKSADKALYVAKKLGKNQLVIAERILNSKCNMNDQMYFI